MFESLSTRIQGAFSSLRGEVTLTPEHVETALREIEIPPHERGSWRVEADFIASIRKGRPVEFTSFAAGVRYMEFTEATARSAASGHAVDMVR